MAPNIYRFSERNFLSPFWRTEFWDGRYTF